MNNKIALCDSDPKALSVIAGATESLCRDHGIHVTLDRFRSCEMLLQALEEQHYIMVLLEIDMPDMDGIQAAKQIRQKNRNVKIVFVSGSEGRVFEALMVQPLGFVRKNHFFEDLAGVIGLYAENHHHSNTEDTIEFITRGSVLTLEGKNIRYIEGSRNYQLLYISDSEAPVEVKMTMSKLESLLEPHGFLRTHKGYLVNYRCIQRIAYDHVILRDGTTLPVGRSKAAEVKASFLSLLKA